jgi:hypothetical protein
MPLHDDHPLICPQGGAIQSFAERQGEFLCYFSVPMALTSPTSHVSISESNQHGEKKMKQLLKVTAAPAAALFAVALFAMMTPATAKPGEYCRQDVTSGMRSCSFATLEQCQAMSAGRGGSCYRDPFLVDTSNAYAYQPKHSLSKSRVRHVKTPLENQ